MKEERMTTFQHVGCSLGKLVAFFAIALLWNAASCAEPASQSQPVVQSSDPQCNDPDPNSANRYVLLLFFNNNPIGQAAAAKAFHLPDEKQGSEASPAGCIPDPDEATNPAKNIRVMGGCPTDCAAKNREMAAQIGDPLSRLSNKHWALFFADPTGGAEAQAGDDMRTSFRAWQVRTKDSCHAGRILHSLNLGEGYLGQIMIGYTYAPAKKKRPTHEIVPKGDASCTPWKPPPAKPR
jgi:hypothetical protein